MYARFGLDVISHKIKLAKRVGILTCFILLLISVLSFLLEIEEINENYKRVVENNILIFLLIFLICTCILILLPEFKNLLIYIVIILWIV